MSTLEKLRAKFFEKPYRTDLGIHDVRCFLESYGFIERKRDSGSSHIIFGHATGTIVCVAVLAGKNVKACYIRECVNAVIRLKEGSNP